VLGAWGCGAYGNPVKEVAKAWRKVIAGSLRQRRPNVEKWQGIKEVVFAIPDRNMAKEFEIAFKDVLSNDAPTPPMAEEDDVEAGTEQTRNIGAEASDEAAELMTGIQETEMQIELITNARSRQRLREVLANLNRDLAQSLAARRMQDEEDLTHASDEDDADATNGEEESNSVYNFDSADEGTSSGNSSDATVPEAFEFRPQPPGLDFETSQDEDDEEPKAYSSLLMQPSPNFDSKTGWFSGSIDQLQGLLRGGGARQASHASPVLCPEGGGPVIDEFVLEEYLEKYDGEGSTTA